VALLPALLAPSLAAACAVCFTGRSDETRVAFLATTVLLTALPLAMIGSLVWWLRRRAQQLAPRATEASDEPSDAERSRATG
jgi:ABC-type spermidine/putrescine transport system permease subunit II